jgi:diacylglycerol kinase (ATP)
MTNLDDAPTAMTSRTGALAVVAHRGKSFGDGLDELRNRIGQSPWGDRLSWTTVDKSRKVTAKVEKAIADGAVRVIVWGGDGTVQRAIDGFRDADADEVALGVLPAGTANLFATNHGIPSDYEEAIAVALGSHTRRVDVGEVNGERFGVMAGTGLDALMIRDASKGLKDRVGKVGYVWTSAKNLRNAGNDVRVRVDGADWYEGRASCVLVANVGTLIGGLEVFDEADPTDGRFEVGIVSADTLRQWAALVGRALVSSPTSSPALTTTRGRKVRIELQKKQPYELDGGDRPKAKVMKFRVRPLALRICTP